MITQHFKNTLTYIHSRKNSASTGPRTNTSSSPNPSSPIPINNGGGVDAKNGNGTGNGNGAGADPRWDEVDVAGAMIKMGLTGLTQDDSVVSPMSR